MRRVCSRQFFIAAERIRDVLGRMIRGSTRSPRISVARTSLPEIETGFSLGCRSVRSTRASDS